MVEELETQVETTAAETNDRAELESRVAEGLSKAFTSDDSDEIVNVPAESEKVDLTPPHKRPEVKEETPAEEISSDSTESTPKAEAEAETPAAEAVADKSASTLPAAYRRSLKAYEWTDEEIDNALKNQGDAFLATAGKIHATRSKELQQFAAAGRALQSQRKPVTDTAESLLKNVDVADLQKLYGADEALITKMAGPVNEAIAKINAAMPRIRAAEQFAQQAQLETFGRQLDMFFSASDNADSFGKSAIKATEEQLAARTKVVELADALIAGGRQQGRNLSMDDALQMAADATTTVTKKEIARKEIAKTLVQRSRSITLKPTARQIVKPVADRSKLEAKVKTGLAKAFS